MKIRLQNLWRWDGEIARTPFLVWAGLLFAVKYNIDRLVYYENYPTPRDAINREKQLKGWRRSKKIALVKSLNPRWTDLSGHLYP